MRLTKVICCGHNSPKLILRVASISPRGDQPHYMSKIPISVTCRNTQLCNEWLAILDVQSSHTTRFHMHQSNHANIAPNGKKGFYGCEFEDWLAGILILLTTSVLRSRSTEVETWMPNFDQLCFRQLISKQRKEDFMGEGHNSTLDHIHIIHQTLFHKTYNNFTNIGVTC